ncbi:unnamed protein product [Angiostrongylus costaricensis]|uniref:UTP--glucose-1-phosphate uridylyltransferase n=1 Tax=Angiostrongylus costaricensis TaxID=334426 RepID=A0A0R3PBI5_ANGCS|nr:unnamed protein product [Angiostrongylus costaricensis]
MAKPAKLQNNENYAVAHTIGEEEQSKYLRRDIMFVSNIDNSGATLDLKIAQFACDEAVEYIMECTAKTENDIKGGTLIDIAGQLMHLEIPQVPPERLDEFCSTRTFKIFNTNNIWVNLKAVRERLEAISSEIIVNKKVKFV